MYTFIKEMLLVARENPCADSIQRQVPVQVKTLLLYNSNAGVCVSLTLCPPLIKAQHHVFKCCIFKDENHQRNNTRFIVITRRQFKISI